MAYPVYRIFLSSTFLDLTQERRAVVSAIRDINSILGGYGIALIGIDLQQGAESCPPLAVCLQEVRQSDLLITVLGTRYGHIDPLSGLSITELEYDEAYKHNLARVAYYRSDKALCLPEYVDTDSAKVAQLKRFKEKIDTHLKRDVFISPDDLRAEIVRDLLKWVLAQPQTALSVATPRPSDVCPDLQRLFLAISNGDYDQATDIITARRFEVDMRRVGLSRMRSSMLKELLDFDTIAPPTKVITPVHRARLLFAYMDASLSHGPSASRAIAELTELEKVIPDPAYSYKLMTIGVRLAIQSHNNRLADAELRKLLRCIHTTHNRHTRAEAYRLVGDYYDAHGEHERALRWYWKGLHNLLKPLDICPYCLSRTFVRIAQQEHARHNCVLAEDRLGKALMVAKALPCRELQAEALQYLAHHYFQHERLREGVAAYVWMARLMQEVDPTEEAANLELLLGDVIIEHGRDQISNILVEVQNKPEDIVLAALSEFKILDFAERLPLDMAGRGDHW